MYKSTGIKIYYLLNIIFRKFNQLKTIILVKIENQSKDWQLSLTGAHYKDTHWNIDFKNDISWNLQIVVYA